MVFKRVSDDLFITGKDEELSSTIDIPQGFQLKLTGTVDVIDRTSPNASGNDVGRILINGKDINSVRKTTTYKSVSGTPMTNITVADDDDIIYAECVADNSALTLGLPAIATVHPKSYTFHISGVKKKANRAVSVVPFGYGNGPAPFNSEDWYNGHREIVQTGADAYWYSGKGYDTSCSFTIRSQLDTAPAGSNRGTGNNWIIESSNNVHFDNHIYLEEVQVASTADEDITTLAVGDTIDGYTLAHGDRILLKNQTDKTENGIWEVVDFGAGKGSGIFRPKDFQTGQICSTSLVHTNTGDDNANNTFRITNIYTNGEIGTDDLDVMTATAFPNTPGCVQYVGADGYSFDGSVAFTYDGTSLGITSIQSQLPTANVDLYTNNTSGTITFGGAVNQIEAPNVVFSDSGSVTQTGSASDAVTLNRAKGRITTVSLTTASHVAEIFTLNNDRITADSAVIVWVQNYSGSNSYVCVGTESQGAGTIDIVVFNAGADPLNGTVTIGYVVM